MCWFEEVEEDAAYFWQRCSLHRHCARIYRFMRLQSVEDFVDSEVIEEKVKQISLNGHPDDKTEAIRAFQRGLKRRREGKPDDDWGWEDATD